MDLAPLLTQFDTQLVDGRCQIAMITLAGRHEHELCRSAPLNHAMLPIRAQNPLPMPRTEPWTHRTTSADAKVVSRTVSTPIADNALMHTDREAQHHSRACGTHSSPRESATGRQLFSANAHGLLLRVPGMSSAQVGDTSRRCTAVRGVAAIPRVSGVRLRQDDHSCWCAWLISR